MTGRMNDHELMLWLFITGSGRWEANTKELCFDDIRYSCSVDLVGLPELNYQTRNDLRNFYFRMTSACEHDRLVNKLAYKYGQHCRPLIEHTLKDLDEKEYTLGRKAPIDKEHHIDCLFAELHAD